MTTGIQHGATELLHLAQRVQELSTNIISHLKHTGHQVPNSTPASPAVPIGDSKYDNLRSSLNDAASTLLLLVNGPTLHARKLLSAANDLAAYQVAFDFDFFNAVPVDGVLDLHHLSEKTGIDADRAGRIIRTLATQHMFEEVGRNKFAHTNASAIFVRDPELFAACQYTLDEMFKAAAYTSESIKAGTPTAFVHHHGEPPFEYYQKNPAKSKRFAEAMKAITRIDRDFSELKEGIPWADLGNAKVVDVGGGSGHVSAVLAQEFPNLSFVIQDNNPKMFENSDRSGLEHRLEFRQHDFFHPQPITDANVYFFRQVFHVFDDEQSVQILKAMVPALEKGKPGTTLLINDNIMPEPGTTSLFQEHTTRQNDMLMMYGFGAKQRTQAEFAKLLRAADPRYEMVHVSNRGGMGLIEVHLNTVGSP